ncbi:MAG: hypothetical protein MSA09_10010 [Lachnospiraceae bacterium]|nr:hypothetical protein [Lachnospiraceae bacterium]MDD7176905.1 hypothetical protein [bacterium]MDY5517709.1 hypothetical protein [Lachnospiraceae bacterium]
MSEKKIIGLFGAGQTDICIYVASILQNMGFHVCVVDNSYEQAMHYCIPHPVEKLLTITYKKIDYECLVPVDCWQEKDYDYLIVDMGVWPSEDALQACGERFLVLDCSVAQIARYRELMKRAALPMNVILRDVCAEAVSARRIFAMLQEENCFVVDSYVLPLNEDDMAGRFCMQYQGYQSFEHLSVPFEKMLVKICRELSDCEDTQIWRSLKRARKGVCA